MPKPTVNDVVSILDPMLSDNFVFYFPKLPPGLRVEGLGSLAPDVRAGSNLESQLAIQCRTATKPGSTLEVVAVDLFGHSVQYAGRLTFSHSMSIEYVEDRSATITRTLSNWQQLARHHFSQHGNYKTSSGADGQGGSGGNIGVFNPTGDSGGYARDALFIVYDQAGFETAKFKVYGCWPSEVPDLSFDGSGANLISVSATFTYDYYESVKEGDFISPQATFKAS